MKFTIKRIYNNNSALVEMNVGKEAVVQGKGIGFSKRTTPALKCRVSGNTE